ncbi:MAG: redoxin domain-containing protein [Pirellulaceae bacterium]|nr:redoxin domain-containing protein [Pirellulaceae bacterium]
MDWFYQRFGVCVTPYSFLLLRIVFVVVMCPVLLGLGTLEAQGQKRAPKRPGVSDGSSSVSSALPERWEVVAAEDVLVLQRLLPILHSAEAQADLKLDQDAKNRLRELFEEVDGDWWLSRNMPEAERRQIVAGLEAKFLEAWAQHVPTATFQRTQQLELQAQSVRALLRPDVAGALGLSARQTQDLTKMAQATDEVAREIQKLTQEGKPSTAQQKKLAELQATETRKGFALLDDKQKERLQKALGPALDLSGASRVYPLAPEFSADAEWHGEAPGPMSSLRGKVVILHFYAFQCINCRRNFDRYNEWVDRFQGQDVVVVGIQTPELPAERDPEKIRAAAIQDKLKFPVLMDLDSHHWNAWGNTMWPTVYVIDQEGYIRMWWQGELNWQGATGDQVVADAVTKLLGEK